MCRLVSFSFGCVIIWIDGSDGICIIVVMLWCGDKNSDGVCGVLIIVCSVVDGSLQLLMFCVCVVMGCGVVVQVSGVIVSSFIDRIRLVYCCVWCVCMFIVLFV